MITTVTLNPAVDKTFTAIELIPGQVNRMKSLISLPGGKGINVAKILQQYQFPVRAMGFLGGYAGKFIHDAVEELGISCAFTYIEKETRTNTNIIGDDRLVTEILEPGPVISEAECYSFMKSFEESCKDTSLFVFSGSIANGLSTDIYGKMLRIAKTHGVRVLLDSSGEALIEGLKEKPFLCKPNRKELSFLAGRELNHFEEILAEAVKLQQTGIPIVLVSMGEEGLLAVEENCYHLAKVSDVPAVNTVGCGDSVIAAFAMALEKGESTEEAVKSATAISAANATTMQSGVIPMDTAELYLQKVRYSKEKIY